MQTRRKALAIALTAGAAPNSALKPSLTSIFKHSKARTSVRTLVTKPGVKSTETKGLEIETSTLSIQNDTPIASVLIKETPQTQRTRKVISPSAMEIEPTDTTAVSKSKKAITSTVEIKGPKLKVPEDNPWMKRPKHVPSYAQAAVEHLCKVDPGFAPLVARHTYTIDTNRDTNYFRVLARTIIGQQIHWKAAKSIIFKFVSYYFPGQVTLESLDYGDISFPTPDQVLSTSMDQLRLCGLSERKASYIQDLARHFSQGKITFTDEATLQSMTDEEVASQLLCVRGIGPWTVDMFLMNALERLDVLPTLDLGIRKGMEMHFADEYKNGVWGTIVEDTEEVKDENEVVAVVKKTKKNGATGKGKGKGKAKNGEMTCEDMERMAEKWRPYRSIASWYMWRAPETITAPI